MSDYNEETTFLRRILFYDASSESKRVEESIARAHRDCVCVRKAAEFAAVIVVVASVLTQAEFFQSKRPTVGAMRCGTCGVDLPSDVSVRFSRVSREVEPVERRMPQSCSNTR